jgi:hypothetical protein
VVGEATAPASVITISNPGIQAGTVASFEATGFDASGTPIVRGTSVPFVIYTLDAAQIPIFVARTSAWSRPPQNLGLARNFPVVTVAWHQYIISAGGEVKDPAAPDVAVSPAVPDVYDAIDWEALKRQPAFPRAPKSMVLVGTTLLCIDDAGATWIDLYDDRQANETAPPGLTFAEVAGGSVYELADGSSYVVGGTRPSGDPTSKVLRIDKSGLLKSITLAAPRLGAAAGVVGGNLVVWGGSADGPGAEVLNKTEDGFTSLPFAPDPSRGLGLATFDGSTALLAGGKDPMTGAAAPLRTFDVTCSADCTASELAMAPLALQRTRVFSLAAGNLLMTGDSDDGEFHAFNLLTSSGMPEMTERPLRERRRNATALLLPNGQPGVLGGEDPDTATPVLSIETFFF